MSAYYNEFDPFAAQWLRELIKDGLIADGVVDERSIEDVEPSDLKEFTQCHFFAGIGGWSYAARLAGWADDRPMWTGSPPCQPFSTAGNRKGKDDIRHLWPVFFNLISECQPPVVFGEQVASAVRMGWFDDLQADMEDEGYATGMAVLPANFIGAPHKRERLFYAAERLADTDAYGRVEGVQPLQGKLPERIGSDCIYCGPMAHTCEQGSQGRICGRSCQEREMEHGHFRCDSTIIYCKDGKYRPIPTEPALFPLANGIPNRVGTLRGAGNAIVPQVGAAFINSYMQGEST